MSLISLLIALMAERHLSSPVWQFNTYFQQYLALWKKIDRHGNFFQKNFMAIVFVALPVVLTSLLLRLIENGLVHFIAATAIVIICFGCLKLREAYKCFLRSAFRGEMSTCELNRLQLLQDKRLEAQGFGQSLVWLNYRYYIAIILFFVVFGAAGALFYRLLSTMVEQHNDDEIAISDSVLKMCQRVLAFIDWLPVRLTAFGYMFVGHFSKALTTWLESLFDFKQSANKVLISVAQVAEDFSIDDDDCTAEPCLLVRLAKRNLLLLLALISLLTIIGVIG